MAHHTVTYVDVFGKLPLGGNPVAVVHGAGAMSDGDMAAFARWTNLSETTFLLDPATEGADYRLRIFTPGGELPFAGHPTLGSCAAWLARGGEAARAGVVVQECELGLISIRRDGEQLAFAAPPLRRSGPVDPLTLARLQRAMGVSDREVLAHQWVDNGPGWCALLLDSAHRVLQVRPDFAALGGLAVGLVGAHDAGAECDFEVRAFVPDMGVPEDPVTGSLNAGIAQWLIREGLAPDRYLAAQGQVLGRSGRVFVERDGREIWIGGSTRELVVGTLVL